jgi:membrane associated rhomboid family serine protease
MRPGNQNNFVRLALLYTLFQNLGQAGLLQGNNINFQRFPKVTGVMMILCIGIYFFPWQFNRFIPQLRAHDIQYNCIHAGEIWYGGDVRRLLTAAFFHVDDMHLFYNMISLLWKGESGSYTQSINFQRESTGQ